MPTDHDLTTDRLALRPFRPRDHARLVRLFREPSVRRYLLDDEIVSEDWVRDEILASERRFGGSSLGLWALRLRDAESTGTDDIAGFAGFREFWDPPVLELTYGLDPRVVGRGLATEAARAACDYGLRSGRLKDVRAAVDLPNQASIRMLERLGLRLERTTDDGPAGTGFFVL
jgi:RimJ/RimL family protein N-acetyltransferase